MVQPVLAARPARLLAAGDVLSGHPPARDLGGALRVADVVDHQDVADIPLHLGRDVGIVLVHVEAVHPDAAGAVMHDLLRAGRLRHVVNLEAAVVIAALGLRLDLADGVLGHAQLLRQLGAGRLAPERCGELRAHPRQLVGAPPDRGRVALVIDDHDVARDPRLVAVRGGVGERDGGDRARIGGIRHVEDRGAEIGAVGDVAHIGVTARDRHLAGAGEIEMAEPSHIAGERPVADCTHLAILSSAPKP